MRMVKETVRLTKKDVEAIKVVLKAGHHTVKAIAESYGVHPSTVSRIKTGKTWRDV